MIRNPYRVGVLVVLCALCSSTQADEPAPFADPYAGYALDLDDPTAWVMELSMSPGVTSKLCIERIAPSMLICIQSLRRSIAVHDVAALARGFMHGFAERFGVARPALSDAVRYGVIEGYGASLALPADSDVGTRRQVQLFGGVNARNEPQLAVAFIDHSDAAAGARQFERVLESVVFRGPR